MTDYTIPMIIGMTLAFALGAVFGALWGLSRHEWLYCRVTAHLTWRMREAMKSLGIEEWKIDKAQEYMGSAIIPPHIPMPEPQVKPERDFDIAFELFPEEKKDFRQKLDGTWEVIRDKED